MQKAAFGAAKGKLLQRKRRPFATHWVSMRYKSGFLSWLMRRHGRAPRAHNKQVMCQNEVNKS